MKLTGKLAPTSPWGSQGEPFTAPFTYFFHLLSPHHDDPTHLVSTNLSFHFLLHLQAASSSSEPLPHIEGFGVQALGLGITIPQLSWILAHLFLRAPLQMP